MTVITRRRFAGLASGLLAVCVLPARALADKASATIKGPASASKGQEVALEVTFIHNSNSSGHFVEWAKVMVNGKEVARWDFSPVNLPEGPTFTRQVKVLVEGDLEISAQANCNRHGSKGPVVMKLKAV